MTKGFERLSMDQRLERVRVLAVVLLLTLMGGLGYFQVLRADRYVELASRNRLRLVRLLPPRGVITDVNGAPLAVNVRTFDVKGYPMDLQKPENRKRVVELFRRKGFPLDEATLTEMVEKQYVAPYRAVSLANNLTLAQVADLVADPEFSSLLFPFPVWRRVYPAGALVSHVTGFVGEITREELESAADARYQGGDGVGKTGIEAFYEGRLRGDVGEEAVEVDSRGRRLREVSRREPARGEDLRLTLDLGAQRVAAELMGNEKGALVVLDVQDGGVKVLYSSPTFDPNPLTWGISSREWNDLLKDPARPMMDRCVSGTYPPGSTFKAVTTIAALEENVVNNHTTVYCPGYYTLGNRTFKCWKHSGHGSENLLEAIRDSCDVFFYQTGVWLGIERLLKWSAILGVGSPSGIDIPGEASGNLAGPAWKKKRFREPWYKGDTVNYSIGQGFLLMTPLQLARVYAAVANGGHLVIPHLNSRERFPRKDLRIPQSGLRSLQRGLEEVVRSGTGKRAGAFGVTVAGKTGTAQNPHGDDHAWFVGYAPVERPRFVAVALVEGGGHGSSVAAPLVGKILSYLVQHDRKGGTGP
ncbi:peptidoglycan glycosyltransferase [Aminomonas paucivorans DSM 12260]|uniref:Peptidoglycan glycosyltransferase n=1 Tax=Aminomonas paucivorans DSM 12260 TaxID=584708 RepID=E3CUX4_9BACT|nr:peptidoglycan glycosyltransferase [Aminomonas paucivorans DSM 12260]